MIPVNPATGLAAVQRVRATAVPTDPTGLSPTYKRTPVTVGAPTIPTTGQSTGQAPPQVPLTARQGGARMPTPGGAPGTAVPRNEPPVVAPGTTDNPYGDNWQAVFKQEFYGQPANAATMQQLFNRYQQLGFNVQQIPHGNGVSADKLMINGQIVDFGAGLDNPAGGSWWTDPSYDQGGGGADPGADPGAGGGDGDWMDKWLKRFIDGGGVTPYAKSVRDQIDGMIKSGGLDREATQLRLTGAREDQANAFRGMESDVRDTLASQGVVSQPGVQQGENTAALGRISEQLAPTFAGAVRDIEAKSLDNANDNIMQSLSLAAGLSNEDARNLLTAVGTGTNRAVAFAQIALGRLSEDRQWNQFLAQNGLDRERLLWEIENGNDKTMLETIRQFIDSLPGLTGGFD